MSNKLGRENRQDKRIGIDASRMSATLAILQENVVTGCLVPVKDFSKSGAGIFIKFQVAPETAIRLSIEGIQGFPIEGKVVWCTSASGDPSTPSSYTHRLGVLFTPKDDQSRENQIHIFNQISKLVDQVPS